MDPIHDQILPQNAVYRTPATAMNRTFLYYSEN